MRSARFLTEQSLGFAAWVIVYQVRSIVSLPSGRLIGEGIKIAGMIRIWKDFGLLISCIIAGLNAHSLFA
jgi:hypothetical protein